MSLMSFAASTDGAVNTQRVREPQPWWRSLWPRRQGRLADIRALMLLQLNTSAAAEATPDLLHRIALAEHPEALWALRQEWMEALATSQGLMLARQRLSDVSFMFAGLLDREQHARNCLESMQPAPARGLVRHADQLRTDH